MPATLTEYDVPIPMRDGTMLRAIVSRPADGQPAPVVLARTPYPIAESSAEIDAMGLARRGLVFVIQSVRGTGNSDGEFEPGLHEGKDGFDTIAWCAAQPWSNGRVGTIGRSYLAMSQVLAAAERPPALRAMALDVVSDDPYEVRYVGGALGLGSAMGWAVAMSGVSIGRCEAAGEDMTADRAVWLAAMNDMARTYRTTPLADVGGLERHMPGWLELLEHPLRDQWWQRQTGPEPDPNEMPIPRIVVAGWFDLFLEGSLREFLRGERHPASRLIVGPWSHTSARAALGDAYYGAGASAPAAGLDALRSDFLLEQLTKDDSARAARASVPPAESAPARPGRARLFVMGANKWRDFETWPPRPQRTLRLYLHGEGVLSTEPPGADAAPSTFTFDPRDPVPTLGGNNLLAWNDAMGSTGQCDQRRLDGRTDVLRFVSEPVAADVDVVGPVRLTLFASTSAADTDWTGKLVDVYPDGRALNVVDSIVRARYREPGREALLEPDRPHEFVLELGSTAQRFAAGHRIRLDVSSSNFPKFDRNPGTGGSSATTPESAFVEARQAIFHDPRNPSRLELPVVAPEA